MRSRRHRVVMGREPNAFFATQQSLTTFYFKIIHYYDPTRHIAPSLNLLG
jgi:hypothetical protein